MIGFADVSIDEVHPDIINGFTKKDEGENSYVHWCTFTDLYHTTAPRVCYCRRNDTWLQLARAVFGLFAGLA